MKKGRFLNDFDQVTRHNPALQKIAILFLKPIGQAFGDRLTRNLSLRNQTDMHCYRAFSAGKERNSSATDRPSRCLSTPTRLQSRIIVSFCSGNRIRSDVNPETVSPP